MSTIKVDTYLTRGGASEIAIDKLKGASSAASISVVAEGGTNTTNLQQGLAKHWVNYNNNATINDSLNTASVTDVGTGNHSPVMTNAMANSNYCISGTLIGSTGNVGYLDSHQTDGSRGTSSYEVGVNDTNNTDQDHTMNQTTVDGDLA